MKYLHALLWLGSEHHLQNKWIIIILCSRCHQTLYRQVYFQCIPKLQFPTSRTQPPTKRTAVPLTGRLTEEGDKENVEKGPSWPRMANIHPRYTQVTHKTKPDITGSSSKFSVCSLSRRQQQIRKGS